MKSRNQDEEARALISARGHVQQWMEANLTDRIGLQVGPLCTVPSGGLSNETLLFEAQWKNGTGVHRADYVIRIPPRGEALFANYDLKQQADIQTILAANGIPAAKPVAFEADTQWLGAPFMLMPMLPGKPSPDFPSYAKTGWLKEAGPEGQHRIVDSFLYWLAKIHRLDVRATGLNEVAKRSASGSALTAEFQWWKNYFLWIAGQTNSPHLTVTADVFAWCESHWPDEEPPTSLLWGDARHGNALYGDDFKITGVLDFENAGLGPAEVDLGWWMTYRYNHAEMTELPFPELPGFPDRARTIEMFEHHLGRALCDFQWYEMFGAARQGACVCGLNRLVENGHLPPVQLPEPVAGWARKILRA